MVTRLLLIAGLMVVLLHGTPVCAEQAATRPQPSARDLEGREWTIPVEGRPTVIVFLSPGQKQSESEIAQVRQELLQAKGIAVLGVVSGPDAGRRARMLRNWSWPLLSDDRFALSGAFEVHAWPTTMVFDSHGKMIGRIAGYPASLKSSLAAYLAYVSGAITRAELDEELARQQIVEDDSEQKASRHLLLVQQLVASGRREDAGEQLKQAKELSPTTEPVRLLLARAMLLLGDAKEADAVLGTLQGTTQPGELALLRGWSAIAQGQWDEARGCLQEAQKLPLDRTTHAECLYWSGIAYQHGGDFARAAQAFRQACESLADARRQ